MRTLVMLTLCSALLLSGCMGGSDTSSSGPATGAGTTGPATTGSGGTTTGAGGAMGNATHYKCTTQVGTTVAGTGTGGCVLTPSGGLPKDGSVTALAPASGCTIEYNANGDNMSDGPAAVSSDYKKGTIFQAFCDATMPPNSESAMDIQLSA